MGLLEIDLNVQAASVDTDINNGDDYQVETEIHLPGLNVDADNLIIDLNFALNSPLFEISSPNSLLLDLNREPSLPESDTQMETELQQETNLNSEEQMNDSCNCGTKKKNLSNDERRAIYEMLLCKSTDAKLKKGMIQMAASLFGVHGCTISRIWKQGKSNANGNVSHNKTANCGRKRVQIDATRLREIPLHKRTTLSGLACSMGMSKTTLHRHLKSGDIRRHTNAIKPFLKDENKRSRLQFYISMLDANSIPHDPVFKGMYNIIHIDEKWFYMTKKSKNYYLLPGEDDPLRTCKSKNFIGKVMFLVALARPRFDAHGNVHFSGKIGVFPFVTQQPAKRSSVNRDAGTIETKAMTSVSKEIIRSFLIEKVLPAIKEKWPTEELGYPIFIQQDNARTHVSPNDEEFCQAARQSGFDIRLMCQPPNSPDLNVLDLGFFRAIQSLQHKECPRTIDELISAVEKSFETYPVVKCNYNFLTLQLCMIEIMKVKGSHGYKIPHINKAKLQSEGNLPTQIKCNPELVKDILHYLN